MLFFILLILSNALFHDYSIPMNIISPSNFSNHLYIFLQSCDFSFENLKEANDFGFSFDPLKV